MTSLKQMDHAELRVFYDTTLREYESCKAKGLKRMRLHPPDRLVLPAACVR